MKKKRSDAKRTSLRCYQYTTRKDLKTSGVKGEWQMFEIIGVLATVYFVNQICECLDAMKQDIKEL